MKKFFCTNCNKNVTYNIRKNIIEEYKGKIVNVEETIAVCDECNTDIFVNEIEEENLDRLYAKYRKVAGIVAPEDIKNFREKYGISQRELVSILGWGKMTINRYENGAVPSKGHSDILKDMIENEEIFKSRIKAAYEEERINEKIFNKVYNSFQSSKFNMVKQLLELELSQEEDILNGFRKFDLKRVENLISYIADHVDNLYKTSLNKYLWYIDFASFRQNVRSITGLRYVKQRYGPVIENRGYEKIIDLLENKFIKEETEDYTGNFSKIKIISKKNYDLSVFTEEEIHIIDSIIKRFKDMSCSEISSESHKEDGWLENEINSVISYDFADTLKINF